MEFFIFPFKNTQNIQNRKIQMGCDISNQSSETHKEFSKSPDKIRLEYRQFVMNTRGEVFNFYHFSSLINRRHIAVIRQVVHRKNNQKRICKIKCFQHLKHFYCMDEVEFLKKLDHPNIVRIHEYFIQNENLYIILEKIKGKNLLAFLQQKRTISLEIALQIMKQLLSAVNMVHGKNIAHRALNPSHIMIEQIDNKVLVKIIDFHWAEQLCKPKFKAVKSYHAKAFNSDESDKNPQAYDIYCCGLIFMILLGGVKFLANIKNNQQASVDKLVQSTKQIKILKETLMKMLNPDPLKRAKAIDILNDKIMSKTMKNQNDDTPIRLFHNLMNFNVKGKLKQTLWMFASINLASHEIRLEFINEFYNLDKNKDGKIQLEEMIEGLQNAFHISLEEAVRQAQQIFHNLDKNRNGDLDFYQFMLGTFAVGRNLTNSELLILFNEIDCNSDGIISNQQLHEVIQDLDDYVLLGKIKKRLNFQEFKNLMKNYMTRISQWSLYNQ